MPAIMRTVFGRKATALLLALLLALAQQPSSFAAAQGPGNGPFAGLFDGPGFVADNLLNMPPFGFINRTVTTTTKAGTTTVTTGPFRLPRLGSGSRSGPVMGFLEDPFMGLPGILPPNPLQNIINPPPARESSVLTDIFAPVPRNAQGAASAAQGVVGASLLTAAGVCIAVAGGLGSGYAGLSEALGLVTGVAGRINLGMEYAKAGLSLQADVITARREYVKAFTQASGAVPNVVEQAAQIRKILTSGSFLPQLESLRSQLLTVRGNLDNIKNAAQAAAAAGK